ncbi:MAG: SRPBCC domain-containing protein [Xanthobacteraceae bacterium]|nr:SRPBCC domain-containing protein [Xanthobacteraceae bacterium]
MATAAASDEPLRVSRVIKAPPPSVYRAFLDPAAIAAWRRPEGMTARIFTFDPREGGGYRMALDYVDAGPGVHGKTSERSDAFTGRFVTLVADQKIVEEVDFVSDDPQFAGTMRMTTSFEPVPDGTRVTILVENAPRGIEPADHDAGIRSSLASLAAFVE